MKNYFNYIHYSKELSLKDTVCKYFLACLSLIYALIVEIRALLYKFKILKQISLNAFIVSVGNITTGGTGKTPITAEIAKHLRDDYHKKVAIISRGYGGKLSNKSVNVISDGNEIFYTAEMAGDEPYWFAKKLKNVIVITGKKREESCHLAINKYGADALILDDGFQYLKLKRNVNIAVIDTDKQFGNKFTLPAGPLREPLWQLKRATDFIFTSKSMTINHIFAKKIASKYDIPAHNCKFQVKKIYNLATKNEIKPEIKVFAFTGIAQPESFLNYIKEQGLELVGEELFADHHLYTKEDINNMIILAKQHKAQAIITTEKDSVKINSYLKDLKPEIPFYALQLALEIDYKRLLESKLKAHAQKLVNLKG